MGYIALLGDSELLETLFEMFPDSLRVVNEVIYKVRQDVAGP